MKRLKATLLTAFTALAAATVPLHAATTEYNTLCIDRTDGVVERLKLDAKLDISVSGEGNIILAHPALTVEYTADEVDRFRFEANDSPEVYDGDHKSSISEIGMPDRTIAIAPGLISAEGVDAIDVYDLGGRLVSHVGASAGSATLDASLLPTGVYILRAGSTSMKIKL